MRRFGKGDHVGHDRRMPVATIAMAVRARFVSTVSKRILLRFSGPQAQGLKLQRSKFSSFSMADTRNLFLLEVYDTNKTLSRLGSTLLSILSEGITRILFVDEAIINDAPARASRVPRSNGPFTVGLVVQPLGLWHHRQTHPCRSTRSSIHHGIILRIVRLPSSQFARRT